MNWPEMIEQRTEIEAKPADARTAFCQTLQSARKQAGFSLDAIAEQLNLPENTVVAIENLDMSRLPPPAFVRGYIRVYAKIIDYNEEELLRDFDAAVPHAHESELHPLSTLPHEANSKTPLIRIATAMIAIIGALVLIYSAIHYYSQKSDDMEQAASVGNGTLQLPPEAPIGAERGIGDEEAEMTATGRMEETEPFDEPYTSADTLTDHDTQTLTLPATLSEPAEAPAVAVESATEPATDRDVLVLESSAESWAEIRDATGERKFYGLLVQGKTRTVNGVAPFDVFLGNAPAVRVNLNDDNVNMTNHTRSNNIAHFKVSTVNGRARIQ